MTVSFITKEKFDMASLSSFGVSVKNSDNAIGFFGTGLKYALAILLRLKHDVTLTTNGEKHVFSLNKKTVRGVDFDFVRRTGPRDMEDYSFTTELGKQWQLWMAFRELYCNTIDEGGEISINHSNENGETVFSVSGKDFEDIARGRSKYILAEQPMHKEKYVDVHSGTHGAYFYKGVLVHNFGAESLHHYNITIPTKLTEDRTIESQDSSLIARSVIESKNKQWIRSCLLAPKDCHESQLDFDWTYTKCSEEFMQTLSECVQFNFGSLNGSAIAVWNRLKPAGAGAKSIILTPMQKQSFDKAVAFLKYMRYELDGAYEIKFVESLGANTLGLADIDSGTIYIAERVFNQGTKQLASTLLEEFIHLRLGYKDCTRQLQTYLFDRLVTEGEERTGILL